MKPAPFLLLWTACVATAGGCCVTPPPAEKYFDRETPMNALLGFAYSVEAGLWDYAFESVDSESRRQIGSPTMLHLGSVLEEDPDFGVPIRDIITVSIAHRRAPRPVAADPARLSTIEIWYIDPEREDGQPDIIMQVFMILEDGEWRVDLGRTVQQNWPDVLTAAR